MYERLRSISSPAQANENIQDKRVLTLCLLNIRSLKKHSIDIKHDSNVFNSDIIALTETQLSPQSNDSDIRNHLYPFTLYRQDHPSDRFCSLALSTRDTIEVEEQKYFSPLNATKFVLCNKMTRLHFTILLLYRKNNSNVLQYVQNLEYILNTNDIDIVLGDFNINYLHNESIRPMKSLMNHLSYSQIVESPTLVSAGSTLDQVYVKSTKTFDILQNSVLCIYYSDHDAVQISIHS